MRLAVFLAKRHQRGRAWGFAQIYCSGDDLGLINLKGIVVAPRPHRTLRAKRQRCSVTGSSPGATNLPVCDRRKNGAECLPD
jgi:hypothetical protein